MAHEDYLVPFSGVSLCAFSPNLTHTNICMYLQTNYLVKLLVIPISLSSSFIRKEGFWAYNSNLKPVSTLTEANLTTKNL